MFNVEKWIENNTDSNPIEYYDHGESFRIYLMNDGWYAVFHIRKHNHEWVPLIQSKDLYHAKEYCVLYEPLYVPADSI